MGRRPGYRAKTHHPLPCAPSAWEGGRGVGLCLSCPHHTNQSKWRAQSWNCDLFMPFQVIFHHLAIGPTCPGASPASGRAAAASGSLLASPDCSAPCPGARSPTVAAQSYAAAPTTPRPPSPPPPWSSAPTPPPFIAATSSSRPDWVRAFGAAGGTDSPSTRRHARANPSWRMPHPDCSETSRPILSLFQEWPSTEP